MGFFTAREAARYALVPVKDLSNAVKAGVLPEPALKLFPYELTFYYSIDQIKKIEAHFAVRAATETKPTGDYLSQQDMAKTIGVTPETFRYLVRRGVIPKPTKGFGKRFLYARDQVEKMAEAYTEYVKSRKSTRTPEAMGGYTANAVACLAGVPAPTFWFWIKKGYIPAPTRQARGFRYKVYTEKQVEEIRQVILKKDYWRNTVGGD